MLQVNNAGWALFKPCTIVEKAEMETMMNLHVYSPLRLSQLFMEELMENKGDKFVYSVTNLPICEECEHMACAYFILHVLKIF